MLCMCVGVGVSVMCCGTQWHGNSGACLWLRFDILYAKLIGINVMKALAIDHIAATIDAQFAMCAAGLLVQADLLIIDLSSCGAILV